MIAYRFEIFIPLQYNDGTDIEPEKHLETRNEVMKHFQAGLTWEPIEALGQWPHEGTIYYDKSDKLEIIAEYTAENPKFMKEYKETLKDRYQQHEILIIMTKVEIL